MKEIPLTQGKVTLVDDDDFEYLNQWKWYCSSNNYALRGAPKHIRMHRVIMRTPAGVFVDHINHNKLDNRKENLRNCTKAENCRNQLLFSSNTSGYKGVYFNKWNNKWMAQLRCFGEHRHLGYFSNPEDAARAYDKEAIKKFGEFALLNFSEAVCH